MTIKQYQKLAKTVADKITKLGGNPRTICKLKFKFVGGVSVTARNPKVYDDKPCTYEHGEYNAILEFDTISNPNNPNYKFRTLKPGSMSFYNSKTRVNVDITDFNFDPTQFNALIKTIKFDGWELV